MTEQICSICDRHESNHPDLIFGEIEARALKNRKAQICDSCWSDIVRTIYFRGRDGDETDERIKMAKPRKNSVGIKSKRVSNLSSQSSTMTFSTKVGTEGL